MVRSTSFLEHKRNCLIALYPHLVLWVRARTDSRVTSDLWEFVMQVRDRCLEKHSNILTCTPQACREIPEFYFVFV